MLVIYSLYVYLLVGFFIALWFVFIKIKRLDHAAEDTPFNFKLILIPACVLLWPYITYKSFKK